MITPDSVICDMLKRVPLFSVLSDREIRDLTAIGSTRRIRRDELIFLQGDPGQHFFIILEGRIRIFLQDARGREVILAVLGREDFFGEMSLFDGQCRSASAQAQQETRVYCIGHEDFNHFLERTPAVSLKMLRYLSERLRHADAIIENLALLSVKGRLARLLADWGEKDGRSADGKTVFRLPMPKTEIAQMLGTSRETVSRMMSELHDEGVIELDKSLVRVAGLDRLRQIP
ncbi:MAG: Crp/Fnr family transcriptional regulator [Proteobacteria bacterium]|nr:Crp/Fnr family transcriptional regulator [Pseudomonadota bacterium]